MAKCFGDVLKMARREKGLTLRGFCLNNGIDPGNQSKYERNLLAPPSNPHQIIKWLRWMGYKKGDAMVAVALSWAEWELKRAIEKRFREAVELH